MGVVASPARADVTYLSYQASVDVQVDFTISATFESIQKCTPGEKTSGTYRFDYESGGKGTPKPVKFQLVNGIGGTASGSLGRKGGAREIGTNGGWEFSLDDCIPETDVQLPAAVGSPQCKTLAGRVQAFLLTAPEDPDPDDLAPLATDGVLAFYRKGGGAQNLSCLRFFQSFGTTPDKVFSFSTALAAPGVSVPGDLFAGMTVKLPKLSKNLNAIAGGKTEFTRKFSISGPCYAYSAKAQVGAGHIGAVFGSARYETCSIKGSGMVIFRRKGKVTKIKVPGTASVPGPVALPTVP